MTIGLFGQSVVGSFGSRQMPLFHQPVVVATAPLPQTAADRQIAAKFKAEDTPPISFPYLPPKRTGGLKSRVADALRAKGLPFVLCDEAKKKLFGPQGERLTAFHCVVYSQEEGHDNWLMHVGPLNAESRDDMEQWERIFGPGYVAVFASSRKGGVAIRNLAGIVIEELPCQP